MSIYSTSSQQTLHARKLLKDWAGQGLITHSQYQRLEQETVSDLRTTNVFLRLVLFLFTLICVGAAVALFLRIFLMGSSDQAAGVSLLICAAVSYAAAEFAVSQARLYRYGIEEALAACSVGFLCAGIGAIVFSGRPYSPAPHALECLVPAVGAVSSLWIWRRFGLWYAFLAAMIFVVFLPGYWTASHPAQHSIVAAFYALALVWIMVVRSRRRVDDVEENDLEEDDSLVEALLWFGIYLALNLKLSSFDQLAQLWVIGTTASYEFARPFYWTTWVLIWCLPAVILARGIRRKDRFVIGVGAVAAILTFISNKPYLGWPRHTWDPMLLGMLLTAIALFLRRWLASGPGGIRHGFTSARLSGKDKLWMDAGSAVLGLVTPQSITPGPQPSGSDFRFGGGQTGGGGAGGDFR